MGAIGTTKSPEEVREAVLRLLERAESGGLSQAELLRFLAEIAPEVERVCTEYGETSDRCVNMRTAIQRIADIMPSLPFTAESSYGIGTVIGVGVGGLVVGALVAYLLVR